MKISKTQALSAVFWPSFVIAGIANSLFFVFLDPHDFTSRADLGNLSRTGAYSVGFLVFWAVTVISSVATAYLLKPCATIPPQPADADTKDDTR